MNVTQSKLQINETICCTKGRSVMKWHDLNGLACPDLPNVNRETISKWYNGSWLEKMLVSYEQCNSFLAIGNFDIGLPSASYNCQPSSSLVPTSISILDEACAKPTSTHQPVSGPLTLISWLSVLVYIFLSCNEFNTEQATHKWNALLHKRVINQEMEWLEWIDLSSASVIY